MFNKHFSVLNSVDSYKVSHFRMYPDKTTRIVSNLTPRGSRIEGINDVVFYGLQGFVLSWLFEAWGEFFKSSGLEEIDIYEQEVRTLLNDPTFSADNFRELHKLGYLPIEIRAVREGTRVPMRVPVMTMHNTHPGFAWLTNFLETQISAELWKPITVASIAARYREVFDTYAEETGADKDFVNFQGHDFSLRGMSGISDGATCGSAHLLSFQGTDTIPAIIYAREMYGAEGFVGGSVPATEHSIAQSGGLDEQKTIERLIRLYPSGILSVVSDTWDFWKIVREVLPELKCQIMAREGKYVVRPDSGDPVKVICGDPDASDPWVRNGLVQCLWDIFGGTVNAKGFKVLDSHIGMIYGDSITLERQQAILEGLKKKGFASSNVVLGIGSYTYNYLTRDTFGFAIKATYAEIDGQPTVLYKAPKTDNGVKNSARGLCVVKRKDGKLVLEDGASWDQFVSDENLLVPVFKDGVVLSLQNFDDIRKTVAEGRYRNK